MANRSKSRRRDLSAGHERSRSRASGTRLQLTAKYDRPVERLPVFTNQRFRMQQASQVLQSGEQSPRGMHSPDPVNLQINVSGSQNGNPMDQHAGRNSTEQYRQRQQLVEHPR